MSYWVNIDLRSKSFKLHAEKCIYCQPYETSRKGVNRLHIDGGWLQFENKKDAKNYWKQYHESLKWATCKKCEP